jgi:phage shock protein E
MDKKALFLTAIVMGASITGAFAQAVSPENHAYASPEKLSALLKGDDKRKFLLLDVRTEEEYLEGHIPGAVNLPYDDIGKGKPDFPKDELVIVYCRSGRRSAIAAEALKALGFSEIADFGAVSRWKDPLVKGKKNR